MTIEFNLSSRKIIIVYTIFYVIITYISNKMIFNDSFYYSVLNEKFTIEKIDEILNYKKRMEGATYCIPILIIFIKCTLVSILIFIVMMLYEIEIKLKNCFKIALIAELMPLISIIIKTLYFYIYPANNIESVQNFNPFGISNYINHNSIPKYFLYPVQQLNIFEVLYWLLLAYGIKYLANIDLKKSLIITSLSYGVGLAIWCIFIMFLQLQFN